MKKMIDFDYQIIKRPRRKTAAISVRPDCSVRILVPATLPDHKIVELVKKKSKWVNEKIEYFQELQKNHRAKEFVSGELFSYLGRKYRLNVVPDNTGKAVKLKNGRFNVHVPPEISDEVRDQIVREQLIKWYWEHAVVQLTTKTRQYGRQMKLFPVSVGVKGYKSRWGSCHSDGRIYYNWRLIMALHRVVDYVVVHELSHLVHGNHSKKFWKLVGAVIPDFAERKQWLRMNGAGLEI